MAIAQTMVLSGVQVYVGKVDVGAQFYHPHEQRQGPSVLFYLQTCLLTLYTKKGRFRHRPPSLLKKAHVSRGLFYVHARRR